VLRGWLNIGLTLMLLVCAAVILGTAMLRWIAGPGARVAQVGDDAATGSRVQVE
jgi:hypothetical protein